MKGWNEAGQRKNNNRKRERKNWAKGLENNGWETVTEKRADEITDKIMTK